MIFIKQEEGKVSFIHYMPFDEKEGLNKTKEELEIEGFLVESIPEAEINGKNAILHINPETKELWYEYQEDPPTQLEQIKTLRQQQEATNEALLQLLLEGVM